MVKNLPAMQKTWVRSLGLQDPLEKGMATHSSILAWRIPWTEEPVGIRSMELHRVRQVWTTNTVTVHDHAPLRIPEYFVRVCYLFVRFAFAILEKTLKFEKQNKGATFLKAGWANQVMDEWANRVSIICVPGSEGCVSCVSVELLEQSALAPFQMVRVLLSLPWSPPLLSNLFSGLSEF